MPNATEKALAVPRGMTPSGMPVPAGGDVAFAPRGLFLRLMSARALSEGEKVEIVLEFQDGEKVPFEATVSGG